MYLFVAGLSAALGQGHTREMRRHSEASARNSGVMRETYTPVKYV
jgi:hypothetical protein